MRNTGHIAKRKVEPQGRNEEKIVVPKMSFGCALLMLSLLKNPEPEDEKRPLGTFILSRHLALGIGFIYSDRLIFTTALIFLYVLKMLTMLCQDSQARIFQSMRI